MEQLAATNPFTVLVCTMQRRTKRVPPLLIINKDFQVYFNVFRIQFLLLEALPVKHCY
jgi:hypothetical protein